LEKARDLGRLWLLGDRSVRDLASTLILLGALQRAVLAFVLARRDADRVANRLLAALVALVGLMLLGGEVERR
jgi:hypothetical protein